MGEMMAISLDQVSVRFGDLCVIDDISIGIADDRIGLIGANGSGKSTMARLIAGLIEPDAGSVKVNGVDVYSDRKGALDTVGIIFQNPDHQIIFPTCAEEIAFGLTQKGMKRKEADAHARAVLAEHGRGDWADRLAHQLSQGQRHYLCLMAVLAMCPDVIVLDEPYAGLDLVTSMRLQRTLAGLDQQVVMITHDTDLLADFDRVVWMDQGRVVANDRPDQVIPKFLDDMKARANAVD
jgi:biotin transport system ATP-binding protein